MKQKVLVDVRAVCDALRETIPVVYDDEQEGR